MRNKIFTPTRVLAMGFAGMILIGAVLLRLPIASRDGVPIPFLNAVFTAASATCVTGLVVYDTWAQFSIFGQGVILLLIQLGGLGFMTAVMAVFMAMHRRIGLRQCSILAESIATTQLAGVVRLFRRILVGTALFESCGVILLSIRFIPLFGWERGIWFALFHSVSAFCNAGFDLMSALPSGASLTYFYNDPLVLFTVMALIVIGGVGFFVWQDLMEHRAEKRRVNLHTKVTLTATALLIVLGAAALLLSERNGAMRGMAFNERLLTALFHSISPRTAGFNTVDIASLSDAGKAVTMLLMFIGAAPGGTGGGLKVTTFVVMLCSAAASIRGREEPEIGRYRIEQKTIGRAFCAATIYIGFAVAGILLLCMQGVTLTDAAFECFSAVGTVGLTTGVTPALMPLSKIMIILLMYAGRVGSFTLFLAVSAKSGASGLKNPVGKIIVG